MKTGGDEGLAPPSRIAFRRTIGVRYSVSHPRFAMTAESNALGVRPPLTRPPASGGFSYAAWALVEASGLRQHAGDCARPVGLAVWRHIAFRR